MKIKKVIKRFERLIPIYEKGIKAKKIPGKLEAGFCYIDTDLSKIFNYKTGYYRNYLTFSPFNDGLCTFLFPMALDLDTIKEQKEKCLIPRLKFLKSEIKHLNSLLKKGYTDI